MYEMRGICLCIFTNDYWFVNRLEIGRRKLALNRLSTEYSMMCRYVYVTVGTSGILEK